MASLALAQVLQVVVTLLAQPYPKVDRRACEHMVTVVGELLRSIVDADLYRRSENRLLKMSWVILRLLWPRVPWVFDERVPLIAVDGFVQRHVPPTSSLHGLWNDVLKAINYNNKSAKNSAKDTASSSSDALEDAPRAHADARPHKPTLSHVALRPARSSSDHTRSPSHLVHTNSTDTTTYSSDTDTTTFVSLNSDDDFPSS